jgi:two-component system, OmpR family, sensor histidine kinase BaeS
MRKSLLWKLTLAFMLVSLTTTALVALSIRLTSVDRLSKLVADQQRSSLKVFLESYYAQNESWKGIESNWQQISMRVVPTQFAATPAQNSNNNGNFQPPPNERRNFFGLADANGDALIPNRHDLITGSQVPVDLLKAGTPITVNGKLVGTLLGPPSPPDFNSPENQFLQRTNEALMYAVIGAGALALLMGIFLARTLIRPIQALTGAAQKIAEGELGLEVKVKSQDEIGQLADSFNSMSREVARVNRMRRQMTADIAHDLRTPLTVIAGYIESMRDGVLQPTTARLGLIYTEIEHLQDLVSDLRMLSQVDAGELPLHPQMISPADLLQRAAAPFEHNAEIHQVHLEVEAEDNLPKIQVDEARMTQVFTNLLSNALRYTSAGGTIRLFARQSDGKVELCVYDDGEGIPEKDLPFIFERFYRVDKSRTKSGETGLGLAIVKALVEAHGGTVQVESQIGQYTCFTIRLEPCHDAD